MPNGIDGDARKNPMAARDDAARPRGRGIPPRAAGRQGGRPAVVKPARSILRGELDHISLGTLLTIVEMERRSGMLILQRKRELGRLSVQDGRVVRARIEGGRPGGGTAGVEAVYELLCWSEGQFELWQTAIEERDEIQASTTFLLMEGARRSDEAGADAFAALQQRW